MHTEECLFLPSQPTSSFVWLKKFTLKFCIKEEIDPIFKIIQEIYLLLYLASKISLLYLVTILRC